jgi:hypothetical protein
MFVLVCLWRCINNWSVFEVRTEEKFFNPNPANRLESSKQKCLQDDARDRLGGDKAEDEEFHLTLIKTHDERVESEREEMQSDENKSTHRR